MNDDFRAVFEEYYPFIYNLALKTTTDRQISEEIAQDVLMRLYSLQGSLKINLSLKSWLARVALNASYDRLRSERRRRDRPAVAEPATGPSAEQEVIGLETRKMVAAILSRLSHRDRGLLLLRYSGFSYREMSAALEVRETSVGKLLSRAQDRFEELLKFEEGVTDG